VDVFGSPATHRSAAVQEGFHETDHAGVVDPDAGNFAVPAVMGGAKRCKNLSDGRLLTSNS
jgi:hypothetical protein